MKLIHIIGILAFLVFAVGSASAADTYYLTQTNNGVQGINVQVVVDANAQTITVTDLSTELNGYKANIDQIWLTIPNDNIDHVVDATNTGVTGLAKQKQKLIKLVLENSLPMSIIQAVITINLGDPL